MALLSRTGSVYGSMLPIGRAAGGGPWENDGTTWSSLMSVASGSFDISKTKAFDTSHGTAQEGDCARTANNAPMVTIDFSGNPQHISESIYIQAILDYSSWMEITVDGTVYTQTPSNGIYTWNLSGSLTKIRLQNDNVNGRTYLEGIKIDGQWMVDGLTGTYDPLPSVDFNGVDQSLEMAATTSDLNFADTTPVTIEFFVKLDTFTQDDHPYQSLVGRWHGTDGYCWLVDTDAGQGDVNLYLGNVSGNYSGSIHAPNNSIPDRGWHHIACVKLDDTNSNSGKIYVDGSEVASGNWQWGNNNTATDVQVGNNNSNHGSALNGHISNFRVTVGQALYTSNFTAPTSPLTTTSQGATASNVKILMCQDTDPTVGAVTTGTITNLGSTPTAKDSPFPASYYSS